jgi:hypothetical protein
MKEYAKLPLSELWRLKKEKQIESLANRICVLGIDPCTPHYEGAYQAGLAAQSEYEDLCAELIARGEFIIVHQYWPKEG